MDVAEIKAPVFAGSYESIVWERIEANISFEVREIGPLSQETLMVEQLRKMENALEQIAFGSGYSNPGSSLSGLKRLIRETRNARDANLKKFFTTSNTIVPLLPTKYDLEKLHSSDLLWLEAWILAKASGVFPEQAEAAIINNRSGSVPLIRAFISAVAHFAAQERYVSMADAAKIEGIIFSQDESAKNLEVARKLLNEKSKSLDGFIAKTETNLSGLLNKQTQELDDLIARATAFSKYKQLYEYFEAKAGEHKFSFRLWFGVFGLFSVIAALSIWDMRDSLVEFMPKVVSGNFEFGSALFIILPLILLFWFLRVFLRLAMTNFQLAEDARNRQVLLQTLSALEADSDTSLSPEERAVAYSAIFRSSLADQSGLDIANPTIADIAGLFKR